MLKNKITRRLLVSAMEVALYLVGGFGASLVFYLLFRPQNFGWAEIAYVTVAASTLAKVWAFAERYAEKIVCHLENRPRKS